MQRKQQILADNITRNVLKYMTASGMLFTQKDINNIHMIITKSVQSGSAKETQTPLPFKKKNKSSITDK